MRIPLNNNLDFVCNVVTQIFGNTMQFITFVLLYLEEETMTMFLFHVHVNVLGFQVHFHTATQTLTTSMTSSTLMRPSFTMTRSLTRSCSGIVMSLAVKSP